MKRRVGLVACTPEFIEDMLGNELAAAAVFDGCVVTGITEDSLTHKRIYRIHHKDFSELAEGESIPEYVATITVDVHESGIRAYSRTFSRVETWHGPPKLDF